MHIFGAEDFKGSAKVNTNNAKQMKQMQPIQVLTYKKL